MAFKGETKLGPFSLKSLSYVLSWSLNDKRDVLSETRSVNKVTQIQTHQNFIFIF